MNTESIAAIAIGDVALIVVASRLLGGLARRCGQPEVIGQIIAGIALGPTLLGRLPGNPTDRLFPAEVLPFLTVLSQVAVVLFMFVVGYEMDPRQLRRGGRASTTVALCAFLVPAGIGAGLAGGFPGLFAAVRPDGADGADGRPFWMFMAVALSVTALPVLAAIVRERGLAGTPAGSVATAAAGLMDVVAWLVLAVALVGTGHATGPAWPMTLLLSVVFVAGLFLVVRPLLARWLERSGALQANQRTLALALALGSGWVTAELGLHAVFGGLLAGIAMPRRNGVPDADVLRPMEESAGLLLPLFFVTTGLSFDIGSVDGAGAGLLFLVLAVATFGKLLPAYGAARISGMDPHGSALVAALVNTRGLTELIVLNVALDAGIIGEELFTILVLMALVTTFMTGPLISLVERGRRLRAGPVGKPVTAGGAPELDTLDGRTSSLRDSTEKSEFHGREG
ncbi:Kef-type K+ transport system, membrane component KefB [Streptomyces sp. cf386]|uniref:cation:proton antiporter n=1 Tax=Streptomyces sp. cf386 TaxID=1761904 RepID=UPI000883B4D0|nr:cation:proton antiporter [Streptomyces sp. cf386]SDP68444.1 Kef-type K+ transport system, membrane component KefB [Streptomyces sp. cf386]